MSIYNGFTLLTTRALQVILEILTAMLIYDSMESLDKSDQDIDRNIVSKEGGRSDLSSNNSSIRSPSLGLEDSCDESVMVLLDQIAELIVDVIIKDEKHRNK